MTSRIQRFFMGPRAPWVLLSTLAGSYFGAIWLAARRFPHPYDWRTNVISNLLSPRDNPAGYWLPSIGVAVAGICILCLHIWLERRLPPAPRSPASLVRKAAFLAGGVCLILAALVTPGKIHTFAGFRHVHEMFARTSALGLGLGMLCLCACFPGTEAGSARTRALRWCWLATTFPPVFCAAACGLVVALARWHWDAGLTAWIRGTALWHLGFWEWVGSLAVFLFFFWPVLILTPGPRAARL